MASGAASSAAAPPEWCRCLLPAAQTMLPGAAPAAAPAPATPQPSRQRSSGSFNSVWVRNPSRQTSWSPATPGVAQQLSWAEQQELAMGAGPAVEEEQDSACSQSESLGTTDDVTEWRRGAGSGDEDEGEAEEPLDGRVAGAFEQLNEAIASNNEVEAAFANAQRDLQLTKTAHASELEGLQKRCKRQLRQLADFERAKRAAQTAADELERATAQLAEALEHEEVAREGLESLLQARRDVGAARDDESWNVTEGRVRSKLAHWQAQVKTHRADVRYYTRTLERHTRDVIRRSGALGEVANEVTPFLAAEQDLAAEQRLQEAKAEEAKARAQQAKAEVKQAMSHLEQISLEIASQKASR